MKGFLKAAAAAVVLLACVCFFLSAPAVGCDTGVAVATPTFSIVQPLAAQSVYASAIVQPQVYAQSVVAAPVLAQSVGYGGYASSVVQRVVVPQAVVRERVIVRRPIVNRREKITVKVR